MNATIERSDIIRIFPLESDNISWKKSELEYLAQRLFYITKKIEVRIKNLELAIKTIANIDKKTAMEKNKDLIIDHWFGNCKRLGATPVALFKCKVHGPNDQILYWEFPHGYVSLPPIKN